MTGTVNMLLVPIIYWGIEFESKTLIEVYYMVRFRQWQMMANSTPYGWGGGDFVDYDLSQ